jgi:hypothetical protein
MILPLMAKIRQLFDVDFILDVEKETRSIIDKSGLLKKIKKNSRVGIGVGSRGIANLFEVVKAVCQAIKKTGAHPFIFPAMGSHGGGTSEGQKQVLNSLGISEDTLHVEILSDVKGVPVGETGDGIPVYVDRYALEADHIVLINRVKPHTKFKGPIESGITKMLALGVGKIEGARAAHQNAVKFGFPHVITSMAKKVIESVNFLFGTAIIEAPGKKVNSISILTSGTLHQEEVLLKKASEMMARIPFAEIDLLIVDEIGKDISGTGMDTNITGRNRDILGDFTTLPSVRRIFVRDLTAKTQGNANGIGFADFTTKRLVEKIDMKKTYINALSAMSPEKAAIPVTMDNDREAIEASLESIGLEDGKGAKIVRIKNTSELDEMHISELLISSIPGIKAPEIEISGPPGPMNFDREGNLLLE